MLYVVHTARQKSDWGSADFGSNPNCSVCGADSKHCMDQTVNLITKQLRHVLWDTYSEKYKKHSAKMLISVSWKEEL